VLQRAHHLDEIRLGPDEPAHARIAVDVEMISPYFPRANSAEPCEASPAKAAIEGEAMPSDQPRLEGGCLCGKVRYAISGPPRVVSYCHCSMCRRATGAALAAWATVARANVAVSGELQWYDSSTHGRRAFCPACGSPVLATSTHYAKYYDITVGTLDDPAMVPPARHVFAAYRLPWLEDAAALPAHTEDGRSPVLGSEAHAHGG
jgi:hypothetical protein